MTERHERNRRLRRYAQMYGRKAAEVLRTATSRIPKSWRDCLDLGHWSLVGHCVIRHSSFVAALLLLCFASPLLSQTAEETLFFNAAALAFQDGVYDRAEKEFADFIQRYPESTKLAEALLFQARSALKQQKFKQAITLLTNNIDRAPLLADQYRYWVGESYMQSTNYAAAADTFSQLIKEHPSSVRLLEASYSEAVARFKLGQFARTIDLLQNPQGTFQKEASNRLSDELVIRGRLVLGEALLEAKAYRQAEQAMRRLEESNLTPEYNWQRQYLLIRIQLAEKRLEGALDNTTNLLTLAVASGQPALQAESLAMRGGILEQLNQTEAAISVYTNNLADTIPAEHRRRALLKVIQLTLGQNQIPEAAQQLQQFLTQHPEDAASDVALLTVGELQLRQHGLAAQTNQTNAATTTVAATNFLHTAAACFDRLLTNFPQSPLLGQAYLGKGWCYWEEDKFSESQVAFALALEKLPHSTDQAVARFKLADTMFWQKDFTNALQNYRAVLNDYSDLPAVKNSLLDQALYQLLRASLEARDLPTASWAMEKVLGSYPKSFYAERSQLLLGQSFTHLRNPAEARIIFRDFARRYPESPLRPEVDLAVARSYVQEKAWDSALETYAAWLKRFPTNSLHPEVEFNRAWVHYLAGQETNAFNLFTNFAMNYEDHDLAPYAKNWEADFYFRQGNFTNAEIQYQRLFQNTNWHNLSLAYQARMMAGRAAFARQDYKSAEDYFKTLVTDANCPTNLVGEAYFALGDTILMRDADPANPTKKFDEAKEAFKRITLALPNDRLAGAAWGRIGDCYFQMGSQDPRFYESAIEYYQGVLAPSNHAEVTARSQAEAGWAKVLERQAQLPGKAPAEKTDLLKAALNHYLNIFEGKILGKAEQLDPFWVKEAGFAAASLAEDQKQWEMAMNIYRRLWEKFPVFRPALEKKIEKSKNKVDISAPNR